MKPSVAAELFLGWLTVFVDIFLPFEILWFVVTSAFGRGMFRGFENMPFLPRGEL
jgi:hypothetical protein